MLQPEAIHIIPNIEDLYRQEAEPREITVIGFMGGAVAAVQSPNHEIYRVSRQPAGTLTRHDGGQQWARFVGLLLTGIG
ncbi:MAG: hypothetical protein WA673_18560, partial [Candidatus Acidiferrales bacterium]